MSHTTIDDAFEVAMCLGIKDRLQLIGRIASSVEGEIEVSSIDEMQVMEHWGKSVNKLLDEVGPIELGYPEIDG